MITCGLDLGAGTLKGVLVENGERVVAHGSATTRGELDAAGQSVLQDLLRAAGIQASDLDYVCTTGFGRYGFQGRHLQVSDITAAARGAAFLHPSTRHVIDIGCQSSRAIAVGERGRVRKFRMNQKCAAGGGRFVERCSKYLQVPLDQIGDRAAHATAPRTISSICAVLAESEIINYVTEEAPLDDILMGVLLSLAQRAQLLMKSVGIEPDVALVGGLARNAAMVAALERVTSQRVHVHELAPHAGAVGAALLGHARLLKRQGASA